MTHQDIKLQYLECPIYEVTNMLRYWKQIIILIVVIAIPALTGSVLAQDPSQECLEGPWTAADIASANATNDFWNITFGPQEDDSPRCLPSPSQECLEGPWTAADIASAIATNDFWNINFGRQEDNSRRCLPQ